MSHDDQKKINEQGMAIFLAVMKNPALRVRRAKGCRVCGRKAVGSDVDACLDCRRKGGTTDDPIPAAPLGGSGDVVQAEREEIAAWVESILPSHAYAGALLRYIARTIRQRGERP
jgi:hypothetical protein